MNLIRPKLEQDREGWTTPDKGMEMVCVNQQTNTYEMRAKNSALTQPEIKYLQSALNIVTITPAMLKRWQEIKEAILSGKCSQQQFANKHTGEKGYGIATVKNTWAALSKCNGWKLR